MSNKVDWNFFNHYILFPEDAPNPQAKRDNLIKSIVLGIFTLGFIHAGCAIAYGLKKLRGRVSKETSAVVSDPFSKIVNYVQKDFNARMGDITMQASIQSFPDNTRTFPNKYVQSTVNNFLEFLQSQPQNHEPLNLVFLDSGYAATELYLIETLRQNGIQIGTLIFIDFKYRNTELTNEIAEVLEDSYEGDLLFFNKYFSDENSQDFKSFVLENDTPIDYFVGIHVSHLFPPELQGEMNKVYALPQINKIPTVLYTQVGNDQIERQLVDFGSIRNKRNVITDKIEIIS
jgi:hypothetical protein